MTRGQRNRLREMADRLEREIIQSHRDQPHASSVRSSMRRDIEAIRAALEVLTV